MLEQPVSTVSFLSLSQQPARNYIAPTTICLHLASIFALLAWREGRMGGAAKGRRGGSGSDSISLAPSLYSHGLASAPGSTFHAG
jgi:hypothetical protein